MGFLEIIYINVVVVARERKEESINPTTKSTGSNRNRGYLGRVSHRPARDDKGLYTIRNIPPSVSG